MELINVYFFMLFSLLVGVFLLPFLGRHLLLANFLGHGLAAAGSIAAMVCAVMAFLTGPQVFTASFFTNYLSIRIDGLAAYFLGIIGLVGLMTSVYAVAYGREYFGRRFKTMAVLYLMFLLSMVLVVTLSDIVGFIIAWEVMSVVSFLLVGHEYERPSSSRAAYIYLVMTHVGTAFIIIAFLLLANISGSMEFASLSARQAGDLVRNVIFLFALLGFGTKAGMIPLHIWLPKAHPAAPTHVSALMSAVMVKTAIYGLCRFFLEFLGTGPIWWGLVVLLFAVMSAVIGVLYASVEHDIKKLLAYSSVENIGIILLGVGAGLVFTGIGQLSLAALAWAAALFHVLNHAIFKCLLFLGVGAVLNATHTRDIEHLGGLIRYMPYTAALFLTGAAAISALPPLNGFVSEWLTFQALFALAGAVGGIAGKVLAAVLISLLGLTGALAATCFVKAFGIIFLAKPRSGNVKNASEGSLFMLVPMGFLAVLCFVAGLMPKTVLAILHNVLSGLFTINATKILLSGEWYLLAMPANGTVGGLSTLMTLILLAAGVAIAAIIYRLGGRPHYTIGETWTCGIVPTARMEYTATGFSGPLRRTFKRILQPQTETVVDKSGNPYFGNKVVFNVAFNPVFTEGVYRPLTNLVIRIAGFMRKIQTGSVQLYIGYILAVTIVVLIWSARW
jgi:hydrogenase-4 component B